MYRLGEKVKFDLDEERANQIKELLFDKLNIDKNIRNYEDLLVKKKSSKENVIFIEKMLDKLRGQFDFVKNRLKQIEEDHFEMKLLNQHRPKSNLYKNNDILQNNNEYRNQPIKKIKRRKFKIFYLLAPTKDELRAGALKEIFYFYCRQHGVTGKGATFDQIKETLDTMDIGLYIKFCTEFKIPLSKEVKIKKLN